MIQVDKHLQGELNCYSEDTKLRFENALGWLSEWGISRSFGLGTQLPWDTQFVIESLSDSTIYMAFYTVCHILQDSINGPFDGSKPGRDNVMPADLDESVWDYILLDAPYPAGSRIGKEVLEKMKREFNYWYPVDLRVSGKDLIQNHLTFFLYNHAAIFQQSARCYLNVGRNRGDMCHSFVPNAYMSFFKDTLFAFASARSAETRDALALALVALRLSMAAYFDVFPASKAVWEPLLQDTAAFDVLQRAAAFCFSSKPMDDEVRLRILEITLKRMRKRLSGPIDLLTHDLAGPIAVLFAVPCLRSIDTPFKVATMLAEFNAKSVDLLVCMTMLSGGDDVRERNVAILSKLAELGGVPAVDARLLDWANDPANLHVEAPLEEWGAIPPATSSFWTLRGGIRVNPTSEVLPQVKVEAGIDDSSVNFVSTAPTGWNAVVIRDVGVYTITPELVGEARAGRGNTLHAAQAANFRVTSCRATEPLVFPPDRKGASSAGRE